MTRTGAVLSALALAYLALLAWITLGPQPVDPQAQSLIERILAIAHRIPGLRWLDYPTTEFLANIALFVPLGLLGCLLLGVRRWWIVLLAGIAATCAIEFTQQYLPGRVSDVRDLVSNGLGTLVGILIATAIALARRPRPERPVT